jgi:hypothetical protein
MDAIDKAMLLVDRAYRILDLQSYNKFVDRGLVAKARKMICDASIALDAAVIGKQFLVPEFDWANANNDLRRVAEAWERRRVKRDYERWLRSKLGELEE